MRKGACNSCTLELENINFQFAWTFDTLAIMWKIFECDITLRYIITNLRTCYNISAQRVYVRYNIKKENSCYNMNVLNPKPHNTTRDWVTPAKFRVLVRSHYYYSSTTGQGSNEWDSLSFAEEVSYLHQGKFRWWKHKLVHKLCNPRRGT